MSSTDLRGFLRGETRAAHDRVEALGETFDLSNPDGYGRFLKAHAAVVGAIEARLEEAGVENWGLDWPARRRGAVLLEDLSRLGHEPEPSEVEAIPDRSFGMGCIYVLEGSRLGGAVLNRRVEAGGDPDCLAARGYLSHGRPHLWREFTDALNRCVGLSPDRVLAGALYTFRAFETAFSQKVPAQ